MDCMVSLLKLETSNTGKWNDYDQGSNSTFGKIVLFEVRRLAWVRFNHHYKSLMLTSSGPDAYIHQKHTSHVQYRIEPTHLCTVLVV